MAHAQRCVSYLGCAHVAHETTRDVVGLLFYHDAGSEWPVVKIERGVDSAWERR